MTNETSFERAPRRARRLPPALLAALLLAAPAAAEASLHRSGGVLGASVTYELSGDPFEVYVLGLSFQTGPTPIALVDPSDPRVLGIGLDLLFLWPIGVLDGAGQATLDLPLPAAASLHGLPLYAQLLTLPGTTTLVDEVSSRNSFALGLPQDTHLAVGDLPFQVSGHTATALPDGRVVLAGGVDSNGAARDRFVLFDPQTQEFELLAATMQERRTQHTATLLADGRVLTLGGTNETNAVFASGEILDPATGAAAPIAPMGAPRVGHTATRLADGRVFVAGGTSSFDLSDPLAAIGAIHASTALFSPATGSWSGGPNLPKPRVLHSASLLGNGHVLLTGGIDVTTIIFIQVADFTNDARRYVPATNQIVAAGSFSGDRALHGQVTLPNGDALIGGGVTGDLILQSFSPLATCRLYNVSSNSWSNVASFAQPRTLPSLVRAGATTVAIGGLRTFDLATFSGEANRDVETSSGSIASWTKTAETVLPRPLSTSVLCDAGERVLTTGSGDNGSGGTVPETSAEVYLP